jgi:hypothetical protein
MATQSTTRRTFTVSFPAKLAEQVERMAEDESRTMSELFREAFRAYRLQKFELALAKFRSADNDTNPHGYGPDDVVRLVREVRAEIAAEKAAK